MSGANFRSVIKSFGDTKVLHGIDLEIPDGEFVVFVGPSGCGKTTLLRLLAGLEQVTSGHIQIGEHDVTYKAPKYRNVAMVFQNYALYPHMTVAENIGFGLKVRGINKSERLMHVKETAELLGLGELLARKPRELSGGQRQRVAMGRAIVRHPEIFLMDEPLSNLDAQLRNQMRREIKALQRRLKATMIYVTHDQVEAMTMADRIVVLKDGRIQQIGAPETLFSKPDNKFVAGFIGSPAMNFMPIKRNDDRHSLPGGASLPGDNWQHGAEIGVRPQHIRLGSAAADLPVSWQVSVELVEPLGGETLVHTRIDETPLLIRTNGEGALREGDQLSVGFDPVQAHLFAEDGRALLQS